MHIVYVTQYFPPEMGAPQARIPELMRQLQHLGHDITVLTAMPNYPQGRIFPGYRGRIVMREAYEELRVLRTWIYPTLSLGIVRRSLSQVSFALSSALLGSVALRGKVDLILVGSPPLFLAMTARWMKSVLRAPYVAVVADLWPEVAIETGMLVHPYAIRLARWMERSLYEQALAVITQTPGQAQNIRSRFPSTNVEVISGGVDTATFSPGRRDPDVRRRLGVEGRIGILYSGLHGFAQGLDVVLDAAHLLRNRRDICFVMIGHGVVKEQLVERARAMQLANVVFHAPMERAMMPSVVASMDVALAPLRRGVPKATIPSKIYEAMASGVPVIVVSDGEARELVEKQQVGRTVLPGDAGALAAAVIDLAEHPEERRRLGSNGRRVAERRYDRRILGLDLNRLLMGLWRGMGSRHGV
jgi:glycosyltransferase involved in cell wall biosynthesis